MQRKIKVSDLVSLLTYKNLSLAVAESCTGGLISKLITDVRGSSSCFFGGEILYSDKIKVNILDVNKKKLQKNGSVSKIIALDMAEKVLLKFQSDLSISSTGFADEGSLVPPEKVGLVYIALSGRNMESECLEFHFSGSREHIRNEAAKMAIYKLLEKVKKHFD